MTVLKLVSRWSEEERKDHADLIAECLNREKFLTDIKERFRGSERELAENLDLLLAQLRKLNRIVNQNSSQIDDIYLRVSKGQGNA
jgi:hypothetical protein